MKKFFKWTGRIVLVIIVLVAIAYTYVYFNIRSRMNRHYAITGEVISIPTDSASIALGEHLTRIRGCRDCHGANLEGRAMIDDAMAGTIYCPNLTTGKGGLGGSLSVSDWMLALRHGVDHTGRPLVIMPSEESATMTETDLAAVIAYCKQVKPVDHETGTSRVGPAFRVLAYLGKVNLLPAEKIEHTSGLVKLPEQLTPEQHGKYLVVSCQGCHRPDLHGGSPIVPGSPNVPVITSAGRVGTWTAEQFMATLRTGKKPDGTEFNNNYMPFRMTANYTDEEIGSLYAYLKSIK